jgi:hypothetical protein
MSDSSYRDEQWANRYAPHVAPINRLVDNLGTQVDAGPPPYVAPMYRGVHAPVLAVLRDPGPKAGGARGSGFLSVENDDQTAERQCRFFAEAGLDPADVVPWNAYPWYINSEPTTAQLAAGTEPLGRLIELMPQLRVVLLLGNDAQYGWRLFTSRYPALVRYRGLTVLPTYHPSRRALQHPNADERTRREDSIRAALRRAATIVTSAPRPPATTERAQDSYESQIQVGSELLPYTVFRGEVVPPTNATPAQIVEDLVRITVVEGPILGHRLHAVYARSAPSQQLARSVNQAVATALTQGVLIADNPLNESGIKPRTFRTPDQPAVIPRELGPRALRHVPPAELAGVMRAVVDKIGQDAPSLFSATLARYGIRRLDVADLVWLESTRRLVFPGSNSAG